MNHKFQFVDAVYRQEPDPALAGNPFVEALPGLFSQHELLRKLAYLPKVSDEERNAPAEYRLTRLGELTKTCIPLPRVISLAQAMHKLMLDGYRNRRPYSPKDRDAIQRLYQAQQVGGAASISDSHPTGQLSMSLIGTPGSGKSFILKKVASLFPPVIYHESLGRWQIPFLFIEMPYDGASVFTLGSQIFQALERLMPASGFQNTYLDSQRLNAERLCMKALNVAYEMGVGMIVVDEAQNQRSIGKELGKQTASTIAAKRGESSLRKLLVTASNTGNMPLMLTGTMELNPTVNERASLARRKVGRGSAVWHPLRRERLAQEPCSEFDIFMRALFKSQWLPTLVTYDDTWSKLFFEHTQGVPDFMVKLYESAQVRSVRSGAQTLTKEDVLAAFEEEFLAARPTLNGLEHRDHASLISLTDVFGLEIPSSEDSTSGSRLNSPPKFTKRATTASAELQERVGNSLQSARRKKPSATDEPGPRPTEFQPEDLTRADVRGAKIETASPLTSPGSTGAGLR